MFICNHKLPGKCNWVIAGYLRIKTWPTKSGFTSSWCYKLDSLSAFCKSRSLWELEVGFWSVENLLEKYSMTKSSFTWELLGSNNVLQNHNSFFLFFMHGLWSFFGKNLPNKFDNLLVNEQGFCGQLASGIFNFMLQTELKSCFRWGLTILSCK